MKILKSINKVFDYPNILDLTPGDFYLNSHEYHLATQEVIVILGVLINNDTIWKAVDLLLENTEDLTTVFKEGRLYKELTKRLVEKNLIKCLKF